MLRHVALFAVCLPVFVFQYRLGTAYADPVQGRPRVIRGPTTATDNALMRYDGADGRYGQNSLVTVDDNGNITLPVGATVDGVDVSASVGGGVPTSRTVSTTSPLGGGGALSSNLTLTCATCAIGPGSSTANGVAKFTGTDGLTLGASSGVFIDSSNRLGIGLASPTNSLTLAAAGTGIAINNVDGANAEYLSLVPVTNVFTISTAVAGSGTLRNLLLRGGTGGGQILLASAGSLTYSGIGGTQSVYHGFTFPTASSSSAVQTGVSLTGTVSQSSSGGFNGYLCNPTLSGTGSAGAYCFRAQAGGSDRWRVDASTGKIGVYGTITTGGTTGAQTINKATGTVNFAASATTLVVTNSLVTTSTPVTCTVQTNDSTAKSCGAVPGSGSVTLFLNAAATAETKVYFEVRDVL